NRDREIDRGERLALARAGAEHAECIRAQLVQPPEHLGAEHLVRRTVWPTRTRREDSLVLAPDRVEFDHRRAEHHGLGKVGSRLRRMRDEDGDPRILPLLPLCKGALEGSGDSLHGSLLNPRSAAAPLATTRRAADTGSE